MVEPAGNMFIFVPDIAARVLPVAANPVIEGTGGLLPGGVGTAGLDPPGLDPPGVVEVLPPGVPGSVSLLALGLSSPKALSVKVRMMASNLPSLLKSLKMAPSPPGVRWF